MDVLQLYLASDRQPVDLQWYELCNLDNFGRDISEWSKVFAIGLGIMIWSKHDHLRDLDIFVGWGADMVDLVIDIACIYGNGNSAWTLRGTIETQGI